MRNLSIFLISVFLVLVGCGKAEEFVIKCDIAGLESHGVDMFYTTSKGLQKASFHPVDGKVVLSGVSEEPVLVEVFRLDGRKLFNCLASNGDELEVKLDPEKPEQISIKGNDASKEYAAFAAANARLISEGRHSELNRLVAETVRKNPDKLSSAMLLATCFDARGNELQADSLIDVLSGNPAMLTVMGSFVDLVRTQVAQTSRTTVRPLTLKTARDTVAVFEPVEQSYSMLVFTGTSKGDSVRKSLRNLYKKLPRRRFKALEISVKGDSAAWASSIRRDSASWMQAWVPGGVGNVAVRSYRISSLPYFVVSDSLGRLIYSGPSAKSASDSVERRLKAYLTD